MALPSRRCFLFVPALAALVLADSVLTLALSRSLSQTMAPAAGVVAPGAPAPAPDPLAELNQAFRDAYARARQQILAHGGPVILVEGDDLVLWRQGKRTVARAIPERYHTLKAVSHVPLALYVLLVNSAEGELGADRQAELRNYRERLRRISPFLAKRGLADELRRRQEEILNSAIGFLDGVLDAGRLKTGALTTFARRMAPLVLANAKDAARAQLEGLHQQVRCWKAEMPADEWRCLRVVVMGSALPRRDNVAVQFFARLLHEPGEGDCIVYAESLFDERRALNLLGTRLLDSDIGTAFFDDPRRMHRDLLGDAAAACLKDMALEP
jgi:hypothetical protein